MRGISLKPWAFISRSLCEHITLASASISSIGANAHEAKYAQSNADSISKLEIALKECYETEYWLEVFYNVKSLDESSYKGFSNKAGKIGRKLIASITSAKSKQ